MSGSDRPTDPDIGVIDARRPALSEVDNHAAHLGIVNLRHGGLPGTVSVLEFADGQVRARHYHREDRHWLYVAEGAVEYFERPVGEAECPAPQLFFKGEMFYTPPMVEHAIRATEPSIVVSMSDRSRTHEEHERDVVRVEFKLPGE